MKVIKDKTLYRFGGVKNVKVVGEVGINNIKHVVLEDIRGNRREVYKDLFFSHAKPMEQLK